MIYKYELTLATGETKEFECPYSPEELKISLSGSSYSLKVYGNILYGNVINYKFIEAVEDTTTEKTDTDNLELSGVDRAIAWLSSFMMTTPTMIYILYKLGILILDSSHEFFLCVMFILGIILFFVGILYGIVTSKKINKK